VPCSWASSRAMAFLLRQDTQIRLPTLNDADYVHDVAYDYYGTRLALCTSSLCISIFSAPAAMENREETSGEWVETARMDRAHTGPIWRLSWGPPDCGEPLASCSEDRTVAIWHNRVRKGNESRGDKIPSWTCCQKLSAEGPVLDICFAPSTYIGSGQGLKIAACTADGKAKIFRCRSEMELESWESEDLEAANRKPAPVATPCMSAAIDWKPVPFGAGSGGQDVPETLALGGRGGRLAIWDKGGASSHWSELVSVEAHAAEGGGVKDLAWCPNLCRPYEIIVTCGAGAKLWRLDFTSPDERGGYGRHQAGYHLSLLKELIPAEADICPVWRCSWNLTGTALALCPEGAEVSVWKANTSLEWVQTNGITMSGNTAQ